MGQSVINAFPGTIVNKIVDTNGGIQGVSTGVAFFMGVTQKGPIGVGPKLSSYSEFQRIYGGDVGIVSSFEHNLAKHVRQYFRNGGRYLYILRVVHFAAGVKASAPAVGYLYDSAATPSSIGTVTAAVGNGGDETVATSGTYTGLTNGTYRIKVTTGGAFGVAQVTRYFTPEGGAETTIGVFTPVSATPFLLSNGVSFAITDGATAGLILNDEWEFDVTAAAFTTLDQRIKLTAKSDGTWGNSLTASVAASTGGVAGEFKLMLYVDGSLVETWDNLSLVTTKANYFRNVINHADEGSLYVVADEAGSNVNPIGVAQVGNTFEDGDDGLTGLVDADYVGGIASDESGYGLNALDTVMEYGLILCPEKDIDASAVVLKAINAYIEAEASPHKWSFAIGAVPKATSYEGAKTFRTGIGDRAKCAIYYNWLCLEEELAENYISPSSSMAGLYAMFASADGKGIWFSPAGVDAKLQGVLKLEKKINESKAGELNERSVNVIYDMPIYGMVCNGSRTCAIATWKKERYIGAVRNTNYIAGSIKRSTAWIAHRPNDSKLWSSVEDAAKAFLRNHYLAGGLDDGGGKETPYYAICDGTVNTAQTKAEGKVITRLGINNKESAEFAIFDLELI